jgi:hypothetical protein
VLERWRAWEPALLAYVEACDAALLDRPTPMAWWKSLQPRLTQQVGPLTQPKGRPFPVEACRPDVTLFVALEKVLRDMPAGRRGATQMGPATVIERIEALEALCVGPAGLKVLPKLRDWKSKLVGRGRRSWGR